MGNTSVVKRKSVECVVNDVQLNFHPCSPSLLATYLLQFKAVFGICSRLFGRPDVRLNREHTSFDKAGTGVTTVDAVDAASVKAMMDQRQADIEKLVQTMAEPSSRYALGRIILDSLREDRSKLLDGVELPKGDAGAKLFMDNDDLDLADLIPLLEGVWRANTERFGPFAQRLRAGMQGKFKSLIALATQPDLENGRMTSSSPDSTTPAA